MKVLIVHHQMALYGGAELVVVRLANYLKEHGHKVTILAASSSVHSEYEGLDIVTPSKECKWCLWDGGLKSLQSIYQVFLALRHLGTTYVDNFDVVNVHNFPAVWAIPKRKRIVWMCNEVPDLWHRGSTPRVINQLLNLGRLADKAIVCSKQPTAVVPDVQSAKCFETRYKFLPEIIPYGIDGEFFSKRLGTERNKVFTVIQPAMISPSKGQMETLKATEKLNARVMFVGHYELRHPYTLELRQNSKGRDVIFFGHTNREELRKLYYTAHVAVFPGKGQGSWLGPFEALSAGVPMVVSPNLNCAEIIRQNNLGTVTYDLPKALNVIKDNYPEYQAQALRGREFVLHELTWDKFGAQMEKILKGGDR